MSEIAGGQTREELTRWLRAWSAGDDAAAERVLEMVYGRVRQLAAHRLRLAAGGGGLQPTELANELVINLLQSDVDWVDRVHFFRTVAVAMRNLLSDMGRRSLADKHGGGQIKVTLSAAESEPASHDQDAEALHEVLAELRRNDPRKAEVVELSPAAASFVGTSRRS